MFVELSKGDWANITHIGFVHADDLILQNVFCVPRFHYKLLSISEYIKTSKCRLLLFSDMCIIQDQNSRKTISLARLQKGLYHLVKPVFSHFDEIRHFRVNSINAGSL